MLQQLRPSANVQCSAASAGAMCSAVLGREIRYAPALQIGVLKRVLPGKEAFYAIFRSICDTTVQQQ